MQMFILLLPLVSIHNAARWAIARALGLRENEVVCPNHSSGGLGFEPARA